MKIHLGARNTLPRLPGALINVWLLLGGAPRGSWRIPCTQPPSPSIGASPHESTRTSPPPPRSLRHRRACRRPVHSLYGVAVPFTVCHCSCKSEARAHAFQHQFDRSHSCTWSKRFEIWGLNCRKWRNKASGSPRPVVSHACAHTQNSRVASLACGGTSPLLSR